MTLVQSKDSQRKVEPWRWRLYMESKNIPPLNKLSLIKLDLILFLMDQHRIFFLPTKFTREELQRLEAEILEHGNSWYVCRWNKDFRWCNRSAPIRSHRDSYKVNNIIKNQSRSNWLSEWKKIEYNQSYSTGKRRLARRKVRVGYYLRFGIPKLKPCFPKQINSHLGFSNHYEGSGGETTT